MFEASFSTSYLVAFVMGLFSSLHCLGMCGSIIGTLTLSLRQEIRESKSLLFPFVFNYNLGRILSYSVAGLFAGGLGHVLSWPFAEEYAYRAMQIFSALVMAGAGLYLSGWFPKFAYIERIGGFFWRRIEPYGRRLMPVESRFQALAFGMVWGWLPCGLVYVALALAATTSDIVRSTLTMFAFGLGTLPAVMGVGIMTSLMAKLSRVNRYKRYAGLFLIMLAALAAFPELNPMRYHLK